MGGLAFGQAPSCRARSGRSALLPPPIGGFIEFPRRAPFGQTSTPATIITYAGNDAIFAGNGQPAASAQLVDPNNIAFDAQGNVNFSVSGLAAELKVSAANGVISVVAGTGLSTGGGDGGLAVGASLAHPTGLGPDSTGAANRERWIWRLELLGVETMAPRCGHVSTFAALIPSARTAAISF
jgi:hypothetical protein